MMNWLFGTYIAAVYSSYRYNYLREEYEEKLKKLSAEINNNLKRRFPQRNDWFERVNFWYLD